MSVERVNGEHPNVIEWGGGGPATEKVGGSLDWLTTDRPMIRGAGVGLALAGFGLLIAAEVLPWMSYATSASQQDFPTTTGGRVTNGVAQLPVSTEILNLGWLMLLAAVATALAVRPPVRRVVVAAGLGLAAAQVALLAGITRGIAHTTAMSSVFRGGFVQNEIPVKLELGLYCAYAAVALLALALLLAGGVPHRLRETEAAAPDEEDDAGPADLTVTPVQSGDLSVWSRRESDIDVNGRRFDR
jgi:hypothetical protein